MPVVRRLPRWFINDLGRHLHVAGFEYVQAGIYQITRPGVVGYLEFSPSKHNLPAGMVDVSCHLGVDSFALGRVFAVPMPPDALGEWQVHWFRGAGYLSEDRRGPHTWLVDRDGDAPIDELFRSLDDVLVPHLIAHLSDRSLLTSWLQDPDPWLVPSRQAAYIAILAADAGEWGVYRKAVEAVERESISGEGDLNRNEALRTLDRLYSLEA